jgi:hypothetical protein
MLGGSYQRNRSADTPRIPRAFLRVKRGFQNSN